MKRTELHKKFWSGFLALPESKLPIHAKAKTSERSYMSLGYKNYLAFYYAIKRGESRADIYINDPNCPSKNEQIFRALLAHKNEIEAAFGSHLSWKPLENNLPCRIGYEMKIDDYENSEDNWKPIQRQMIGAMVRLEKALSPYIAKLN